ncbi:hypothetical protein [Acinetobacter baumannii]|uniref:hypothetical protein n=1 Tax=Acinetobacter baumannii TaxID=470 RepID=UPI0035237323
MKDNNLKDLFQFLLNHKKLIQCRLQLVRAATQLPILMKVFCVLVERNVPFKEYLSFLEIMDKWPEKNNNRGYTVRIEGEDPSEIYLDYYENNKNMYGNCSYGKKRWDLILFVYQELLEAKEVSYFRGLNKSKTKPFLKLFNMS